MQTASKEVSFLNFLFSWDGRLSRRDFGVFYILPSIVSVIIFVFVLLNKETKYQGDEVFISIEYLTLICILLPFTIVMNGKRARDFNFPMWTSLLPFFVIGVFLNISAFFPAMESSVDKILDVFGGVLGTFIFWMPKAIDDNKYGPPIKIRLFKQEKKL